jgi:hypothetical protein
MLAYRFNAAAAETPRPPRSSQPERPVGVVGTILTVISRREGASVDEIVAVLVKAFPDRDPDGMRRTVRVQAAKNCTTKETDAQRGRVYYRGGGR